MQYYHLFKIMKEIMVEWEMSKIPRKELNEIINSVNVTTDIENVTKNKNFFRQS